MKNRSLKPFIKTRIFKRVNFYTLRVVNNVSQNKLNIIPLVEAPGEHSWYLLTDNANKDKMVIANAKQISLYSFDDNLLQRNILTIFSILFYKTLLILLPQSVIFYFTIPSTMVIDGYDGDK